MTQPIPPGWRPPEPPPLPAGACQFCHTVHDPIKCQGHSLRGGDRRQCKSNPTTLAGTKGQRSDRCAKHGGKHPTIAEVRPPANDANLGELVAKPEVQPTTLDRLFLNKLTPAPIENPLEKLNQLAGIAWAFMEVIQGRLEELRSIRYSTDGGEAIRGEVVLFERAMERCNIILTGIAKLNIDERLVRIAEAQKDMVLAAIEAALASAGITGAPVIQARAVAGRYLRVVNAEATPREITAA